MLEYVKKMITEVKVLTYSLFKRLNDSILFSVIHFVLLLNKMRVGIQ